MRAEYACVRLGEIKLDPGGADTMTFDGYGAVFGNVDSYGDVIEPGAFAQFLSRMSSGAESRPAMLSQHGGWGVSADDMTPIGVWTALAEDGTGLRVEGKLAPTQRGRDMYELMKMGAIDGLSIGYIAKEAEPRSKPDEPRRRLKRIDLIEISPVTFPANRKARVDGVKSIEGLTTLGDAEDYLRDAGLSKTQAVALISRIRGLGPGDPAEPAGGPSDSVAELADLLREHTERLQMAALVGQLKRRA